MQKVLACCTVLAGASLLPFSAGAFGFDRFGHGHGGLFGVLLLVAVIAAVALLLGQSARR